MSLSAAVLDALLAAGCTADQIVAAVKADLAGQEEWLAQKRAKDAERQRKSRISRGMSRDVTVTDCDGADVTESTPFPAPPKDNNQTHPTHTPESNTPRARKGHRLPIDWQPKPLPAEMQREVETWKAGALERELSRFRDWGASATGANAVKTDWDAAWRNWVRKAHDEGRNRQNGQSGNQQGGMGVTERAARQALHEITGGVGKFEDSRKPIPPGDFAGGHRTIDAVPDTVRAIGYAGG